MSPSSPATDVDHGTAAVSVRNVGGIDRCELALDPGVTILAGRNATNRTSLLSALGGVLGGSTASLKSDADEGRVALEFDGREYVREYERTADGVRTAGEPFAEDGAIVDLFVALFEDNPARRAVERGDDLREVIMRPVDTAAIERRIEELKRERAAIDDEIATVERRREELPALEERRASLSAAIDEIDDELAALREEVAAAEADAEEAERAADAIEELDRRRRELSRLEDELEVRRAERDALREDRAELEERLESVPAPDGDPAAIERELSAARDRKRDLADAIASLTTIVDFNEDLLSEDADLPGLDPDPGELAAELAPEDEREVVCWTCGSQVRRAAVDERLDDLRAIVEEKREARREVDERIDELQSRLDDLREAGSRRDRLETRIAETTAKIEDAGADVADLEARIADLNAAIADLEERAARTEDLRETDLLETYERISDLQYERGQRVQQLEDVEAEIEEIEALPDRDELLAQRDEIAERLERERGRIDDLEASAIAAFNDHMERLLDVLEYENLARVWIEVRRRDSSGGRGDPDASFDLHVVRESSDGAGYEDEIANLSESEREVIGLVVALAGYLVHEVYERVPFMLLDSVEALDADRIAALVEYFADFAPYLVLALLPEDAAAQDDAYERIPADALSD